MPLPVTLEFLDRDAAVAIGVDLVELVDKLWQVHSHFLPAQSAARVRVGLLELGVNSGTGPVPRRAFFPRCPS